MAASSWRSSMFSVSGRQSTHTGTPPRSANAVAVEQNVNDGTSTSSPGPTSSSSADMSSAWVQEVVSSADLAPATSSNRLVARLVNGPSPDRGPETAACVTYCSSAPARNVRLNGTVMVS